MKNPQVRITEEQARRLHEIADMIPGSSIDGLAKMAIKLWLEVEGTVYLAEFKRVRAELQKRQDVRPVEVIRPSERA